MGQLCMAQEYNLLALKSDGTETSYPLSNVQKIVFESNAMTVKVKSGTDATNIKRVRFSTKTGIENPKLEETIFVFPNPVKNTLTVIGTEKGVTINLLTVSGMLLRSIIAEDSNVDINVSSLQSGLYLLQIGDKTVKFIKQ